MKNTLAFIDEDEFQSRLYIFALEKGGFDVSYFSEPSLFLDAIEGDKAQRYDAIISDLMMPWENAFTPEETGDGFLTGFRLASVIRKKGIASPIVIFTNMSHIDILKRLEKEVQKLGNVFVLRKAHAYPMQFADMIQSLLEKGKLSTKQVGVMRQFFDSLILKPSLFGMGVDLKEIAKIKWRE